MCELISALWCFLISLGLGFEFMIVLGSGGGFLGRGLRGCGGLNWFTVVCFLGSGFGIGIV